MYIPLPAYSQAIHPNHFTSHRHLRLSQNPKLTIARRITRHKQATLRIPRQPCWPEAPRAKTWSITLAALDLRIVEDILCRSGTRDRVNGRVLPISTKLEVDSDKLEACNRRAVPRAVVRNVHGGRVGIEFTVNGRRVGEESHLRSDGLLVAGVVVESGVGGGDEEVTDLEGLVGEVGGLPDGEAGWVAVPVVVGLGDVADVVDLFAGIVLVDVFGLAVDGALEVVTAVFYTPEPAEELDIVTWRNINVETYMLFLSKHMPTSLRCPYPAR
jgi:hypothetical protein